MNQSKLFSDLTKQLKEKNLSAVELSELITSSLPKLYEYVLGEDKSYVIKRNGLLEEYKPSKFSASLARASDESKQPLGSGELRVLCNEISRGVDKFGKIFYTWQLRNLILEILYKHKYYEIYSSYKNG